MSEEPNAADALVARVTAAADLKQRRALARELRDEGTKCQALAAYAQHDSPDFSKWLTGWGDLMLRAYRTLND